jgi:hypothetical protein
MDKRKTALSGRTKSISEGVRYKNNKYFARHFGPSEAELRFKEKMRNVRND